MPLAPYLGSWGQNEAAHLLRRTLFGPTLQQINEAASNGMDVTVDLILSTPLLDEPLAFLPEEMIVPFESSWVTAVYPTDTDQKAYHEIARRDSLNGWLIRRVSIQGFSIHEKMCLFWQNHFASSAAADSRATFNYYRIIQNRALGNFRELVKEITIDPCMLMFLNGAQNTASSPNENFARELLELYTIGKGPLIGPGDYTNYTEQDVLEGAKILTGWTVNGFLSDSEQPSSVFNPLLHDTSDKTLSYHFNNAIVLNSDENEYSNYIDIIFQQDEVARFICRKIYRWFVNHDITDDVESNIIQEMAATLIANNYEVLPVLNELLKSAHFYDGLLRGAIIKSPLELIFSSLNSTNFDIYTVSFVINSNVSYRFYLNLTASSALMGQKYDQPPNVAGWKAYYQAPAYYQSWINASYIKLRFDLMSFITIYPGFEVEGLFFKVQALRFLDLLTLPGDPVQVIEDLALIFCPKGLSDATKTMLKNILTNSLPDFEWTLQYNEYSNDPQNQFFSEPVKSKMEQTLMTLFCLPEFQTI